MPEHAPPATWLAGYIPDLPTPFDEADRIDMTAFAKLCERQIQSGVSAIVVGETAGEASTLTLAEHDSIVRAAVENVVHEAIISSILVSVLILVFLGSWRNTVIVSASIPLSITATGESGTRWLWQPAFALRLQDIAIPVQEQVRAMIAGPEATPSRQSP